MAFLPENPDWEDGIYQLEETDPVLGGEDGISNLQAKQLANRTAYLKQTLEASAIPAPPATGTATLQSVNGVLQWV
jgi:hypothetical protein